MLPLCGVLACGNTSSYSVSNCLDSFAAVPNCRYRSRRSSGVDLVSDHITGESASSIATGLSSLTEMSQDQPEEKSEEITAKHVLTAREIETLQLLAIGKTNKEVATHLNLSVRTVETHRANIRTKLNLHSLGELIHYAIRNKIISR